MTSKFNPKPTVQKHQVWRSRWMLIAALLGLFLLAGLLLFSRTNLRGSDPNTRAIARMQTRDFHSLMFSGKSTDTVFYGHHNGLMISTDQGSTWQPTQLQNADAMGLGTSSANPSRMYAAGHDVFVRSDDGGQSWYEPGGQLKNVDIHVFANTPADANRIYLLIAGQGLFTSADGGLTIQRMQAPPGDVLSLAASGTSTVFVGTGQNGVYQSVDGGRSWLNYADGLPRVAVTGLALDAQGNLYAATNNGMYRRTAGANWMPLPLNKSLVAVAASPLVDGLILGLSDKGEIFRSRNGGQSWDG